MINELYVKNILGIKPKYNNMLKNNAILFKTRNILGVNIESKISLVFLNIADKSIKLGSLKAKPEHPFQFKYLIYINTIFKISYIIPLLKL